MTTRLSPKVRRLLQIHSLDAKDLTATGAGGRLTAADVERAGSRETARRPAEQAATPTATAPADAYRVVASLDVTDLEAAAAGARLEQPESPVTPVTMVVRAVAKAVRPFGAHLPPVQVVDPAGTAHPVDGLGELNLTAIAGRVGSGGTTGHRRMSRPVPGTLLIDLAHPRLAAIPLPQTVGIALVPRLIVDVTVTSLGEQHDALAGQLLDAIIAEVDSGGIASELGF